MTRLSKRLSCKGGCDTTPSRCQEGSRLTKGCFLNLVPTFPLVNQWKMMSTITKNYPKLRIFRRKILKNSFLLKKIFVIYHLTPEKEQNADEKFRKFMRKFLFFEGKCKKLLTFGKKFVRKTFKIMK